MQLSFVVKVLILASFSTLVLAGDDPTNEIWVVDQQGTDSTTGNGGVLYIYKEVMDSDTGVATLSLDATFDMLTDRNPNGLPVGKRPHMLSPYPLNQFRGSNLVATTHVIISNVASGSIHIWSVNSRDIVGFVDLSTGFNNTGGAPNVHYASATQDGQYIIAFTVGAAGQSGFIHKIRANFATNTYTLIETLSMQQYAPAVGTATVNPVCAVLGPNGLFYVSLNLGGLIVLRHGDNLNPMTVAHIHTAVQVPGTGCGTYVYDNHSKMITSGASTAVSGEDWLFNYDISQAAQGVFPPPVKISLPGIDTHGAAFCKKDHKYFAIGFARVSSHAVVVDLQSNKVGEVLNMNTTTNPNFTPDIVAQDSWSGNSEFSKLTYVALRGTTPLTGIVGVNSPIRTTGLARLKWASNCKSYTYVPQTDFFPAQYITAAGPKDIHGVLYVHKTDWL